jgi:hypothetical protein
MAEPFEISQHKVFYILSTTYACYQLTNIQLILKEYRNIVHSLSGSGFWQLRYKPPNSKTKDCKYVTGYLSEAAALEDIPRLTKYMLIKHARIISFVPTIEVATMFTILVIPPPTPETAVHVFNTHQQCTGSKDTN